MGPEGKAAGSIAVVESNEEDRYRRKVGKVLLERADVNLHSSGWWLSLGCEPIVVTNIE